MARSKIRKDVHGLFVVSGGCIFRPDYPKGYKHLESESGNLQEGELVNANHRGGTPLCTIKRIGETSSATWFSHGEAYVPNTRATKRVDSETVFRPQYDNWD